MFWSLRIFAFIVVAVLGYGSAAPTTDSSNTNPTLAHPCVRSCPIGYDYSPFCASDKRDYPSRTYETCFKNCKLNITFVDYGKCKFPSALENPCVMKCPVTMDFTPFCGTDNNDYPTRGLLSCFDSCSIDVKKAHDGPCPKDFFVQVPSQGSS